MKSLLPKSPLKAPELTSRNSFKTPQKSPRSPNDKVQVIIRIRPLLKYEDSQQLVQVQDDNTLAIVRPGYNNMYMKFSSIVPAQGTQQSVFALMIDSVNSFLKGINNTIFAYGQTGAGKTYTIAGECPDNINNVEVQVVREKLEHDTTRGILPRALEMIFTEIRKRKEPDPKISLSFFQIYNEKIYDLYNVSNNALEIRESKTGEVSIPDLMSLEVTSLEEAYEFLVEGLKNRVTKSTYLNSKSSRSHSIFQLVYERTGRMKVGDRISEFRIRIVDLAGSEKFKIPTGLSPSQQDIRIQQVTCINGSLSSLGHCISALIQKSRTHIPFRNSKLTRILSDSLIGNGKLKLIICISPSVSAASQTFSTLQFANRAKKAIVERLPPAKVSQRKMVDYEEYSNLMVEYQKEKKMRMELEAVVEQGANGELVEMNQKLQKENQELRAQIKILSASQKVGGDRTPNQVSSPRRLIHQPHQPYFKKAPTNASAPETDGKSFLSLSVLKDDKKISQVKDSSKQLQHRMPLSLKPNLVMNKRKIFENKFQKFLQHKSPQKKDKSLGNISRKASPFNDQIKLQLQKIRKAIKSKEEWFEDNNSDELNDTREYFATQTDDQDLFKMDRSAEQPAEMGTGKFIRVLQEEN